MNAEFMWHMKRDNFILFWTLITSHETENTSVLLYGSPAVTWWQNQESAVILPPVTFEIILVKDNVKV